MFVTNYLSMLSTYWIGGVYEALRLLRERELVDQNDKFVQLLRDFELLRVPLEKHEIAKDRTLKEPLQLVRQPPRPDEDDTYLYARKDEQRAHIMPAGISSRGSMMWQTIDLKNNTARWIERRNLSDQMLELWKSE
jgi:hypothetical protein